ncbi:MAG: 2-phospho-L-lactate transferase [Actinomycetia bacterium]|nr:2-phospho-L-lactate transferase [Actinomycetes bacterium]MCP4957870.1 2-phospho-L-lactate transferase [Actinomycetes bacterium]
MVTIAGGVGAAKFLRGLAAARADAARGDVAVVNVADDFSLHGLRICPDLDTVSYTLAGLVNPQTGWGRADETWTTRNELERLGGQTWFGLGDKDLALHLYRTQRTADGAGLAQITREITASLDITMNIVPATEAPVETKVSVVGEGEISFQEYFVGRRHDVAVDAVRFSGAADARPAPGVLEAIGDATCVVVAPSNPIVSIGPVLAIPGIREALTERRDVVVAISPIVGGKALKGPADRMLTELGHESTASGVAELYAEFASALVVDTVDASQASDIERLGLECIVTDTIMSDVDVAAALATTTIETISNRGGA